MEQQLQNNIYEKRTASKHTQEELAGLLDVSRQTVIAMEKGNYVPSVALALRVARVFGVPVEAIFWYD